MYVRDLKRLDEILLVLFEEGFEYIIYKTELGSRIPFHLKFKGLFIKKKVGPEIILKTFERLGSTFIKLGQMLSLRPDLIPAEYANALEKLQDKCPYVEFSEIKKVLEKEFGPLNKIFKHIDEKPIAAASISQVHSAILLNGKHVAVKVLRPNIKEKMDIDIEIIASIISVLENNPEFKKYKLSRILEEFKEWTDLELDLNVEAGNAVLLKKNVDNRKVIVPNVIRFSQKAIIYEFIDGISYTDFEKIKAKHIDFKACTVHIMEEVFRQVFEDGFFHADPHPGNIMIIDNNKFAFLDFGIMGRFSEEMKDAARDFFIAIMTDKVSMVVDTLEKISGKELKDRSMLEERLQGVMVMAEKSLKDIPISAIMRNVFTIISEYQIRIPRDFVLLAKTAATLEGVGIKYYPEFNFVKESENYFRDLAARKYVYNPKKIKDTAIKYYDLLTKFPDDAEKAMHRLAKGDITLNIDYTQIKNLTNEMERSSNRIAYSTIIAAFLIVGALIINVPVPKLFEINIISLICFSISIILIFALFISIRSEGK